jgi:hypothetical protein
LISQSTLLWHSKTQPRRTPAKSTEEFVASPCSLLTTTNKTYRFTTITKPLFAVIQFIRAVTSMLPFRHNPDDVLRSRVDEMPGKISPLRLEPADSFAILKPVLHVHRLRHTIALLQMERLISRSSRLYLAIQPKPGRVVLKLAFRALRTHTMFHHRRHLYGCNTLIPLIQRRDHWLLNQMCGRKRMAQILTRTMTLMESRATSQPSLQTCRIFLGLQRGNISGERSCKNENTNQCRGTSIDRGTQHLD